MESNDATVDREHFSALTNRGGRIEKLAQLALSPDKSEMRTIDERGGGRFVDVHRRSSRFANSSQYNARSARASRSSEL